MPTEVASTEYGVIIHNDEWNTLELKWLPATKDATEAQARDTMALFAAETEQRKPRFLIVDTTQFFHRWADDMMAWRDKEIIPQYNAGGVTKFAFITGEGVPLVVVDDHAVVGAGDFRGHFAAPSVDGARSSQSGVTRFGDSAPLSDRPDRGWLIGVDPESGPGFYQPLQPRPH